MIAASDIAPAAVLPRQPEGSARAGKAARTSCFHCGDPCLSADFVSENKQFCCGGCLLVHDLLAEHGLQNYYELEPHPGAKAGKPKREAELAYLDDPKLQRQLLDFTDGKTSRITLQIPNIHCLACVWLLENLFRLQPGVGRCSVNFPRREVVVCFEPERLKLSELVAFLGSIGYEPALTLADAAKRPQDKARKQMWLRLGIAGFAFGNIMLFSLPGYLGLDSASAPVFKKVFGGISLLLALPVVLFSAGDYWKAAWLSVRRRTVTLDVPIALGLAALYLQSAGEILTGRGEGYLDSLAALVFFLLCGRAFQQKTFERIEFDRDYRCFFPLSANRVESGGARSVPLADLKVGDRLIIRNGELIPADARLREGTASVDYSFITGEAEPAAKMPGDYLYAGGKHFGGAIEVETVKPVSQSHLASLWSHEVFRKESDTPLRSITNRYSKKFTWVVMAVAVGAAVVWSVTGQPSVALKAFASVLIVACPCALALAAPFAMGAAQRALARGSVFVKGPLVLEQLAEIDTVVFDKTGTLTCPGGAVEFMPGGEAARELSALERSWIGELASHSTHPYSRAIAAACQVEGECSATVQNYFEAPGKGIRAEVAGHELRIGSVAWVAQGTAMEGASEAAIKGGHGVVHVSIDRQYRGAFRIGSALRDEVSSLVQMMSRANRVHLLSGDSARELPLFNGVFGTDDTLRFNQSPADKLEFIRSRQALGSKVMMVGDGLNDAGALKQSNVGVAVVERTGAFFPASDLVVGADNVAALGRIQEFARSAVRIVRLSFMISAVYNVVGISIAAAGALSPLVCAVLMPVSSVSVVLFACGAVNRAARRLRLAAPESDMKWQMSGAAGTKAVRR